MVNALKELFGNIATAIRDKTGSEETMTPAEFPEKIGEISVNTCEAVETTVELDFSEGDMVVAPEVGQLFDEVNIPTPATLIPENIAEGVDIAGIVGTLSGSGSGITEVYTASNWYAEKYSYSTTVNGHKTVTVTLPVNAKVLKVVRGYGLTYGSGTSYDHIPAPNTLSEVSITPTSDDNHVYVSTFDLAYKPNRNYGGMYLCLVVFYTLE